MIQLRPHQEKAVQELGNGKILVGDVGTGKSLTAAAYYVQQEAPRDVYVITTAKKRDSLDWEKEFLHFGVGKYQDETRHGVLTVDSWNNLGKYTAIHGAFFIFDEQRLVGSGAWTKAFLHIVKSNRWVLLSATPGDTWLDYIPVFLANGFYKNRTEFKREHVVYSNYTKFPKVVRYLGVGKLVRLRNSLLVEMPYIRHTTRKTVWTPVDHDREKLDIVMKQRWNVFEDKPIKDVAELYRVVRRLVNTDPSRLVQIQKLMDKHDRLIVFYNFDYELEELRKLSPLLDNSKKASSECQNYQNSVPVEMSRPSQPRSSRELLKVDGSTSARSTEAPSLASKTSTPHALTVAEWNGHKHEPVPISDRWIYLVQYIAGAEGWNCVTTDAMAFWSLTYSYRAWHQAHGRIDRMNTRYSELNYYPLMSTAWIDLAIRKALREKKDFNEASTGIKF